MDYTIIGKRCQVLRVTRTFTGILPKGLQGTVESVYNSFGKLVFHVRWDNGDVHEVFASDVDVVDDKVSDISA